MALIEAVHNLSGTELLEGVLISLLFVLGPVLTHAELRHRKREREADRRHNESMAAHRAHAENLKAMRKQL
jgi:hypothetical protein